MELVSRDALFARRHLSKGDQPLMKWDMRTLKDRTDANRELLPAGVAPIPARAHRFAAEGRNRIERAAFWAVRAIRPADRLEHDPSGFIVMIAGMGNVGRKVRHGAISLIQRIVPQFCSVRCIIVRSMEQLENILGSQVSVRSRAVARI